MFQFSWAGSLALLALAMCWSLAIMLFRVGTAGSVARKLSLLLVVEGATMVSTGYLDLFLSETARAHSLYPTFFRAEEIVHTIGDCAMLALYPAFLAAALQTRLTSPFADARVRAALGIAAAVLCAVVLWGPLKLGGTLLYVSLSVLFAFALVASIDAWRKATGAARSRARTFALAFGIRDLFWGYVYAWATWTLWLDSYQVVDPNASGHVLVLYALGTLLAVPLITYGILKTQLFDIDLRIRWTIRQSTVAAAFVAVFYLVTEGADRLLESELGSWIGLLASAMLVFFLAPLQRFAERVASLAMPNTQNTPEYAAYRKLQVYEAALSEALPGGISDKERSLLNHLRDSLEIAPADAAALESDLLQGAKSA
jgi:hypothetical protein